MNNRFKRISFSSLTGRIFAIFWFTVFLVLISVIAVQKMDPRQSHSIQKNTLDDIQRHVSAIERRHINSTNIPASILQIDKGIGGAERRDPNRPEPYKFYVVDDTGNILSTETGMKRRALQNFITRFTESDEPHQQLFGRLMIAGPFPLTIGGEAYTVFTGFKWEEPPSFLIDMFDSPLKLMLVVMVVSTPLLLSLAWAVSQPARRLELAAKRVSGGEFVVDPDLEKGTSEFKQTGKSFNQMVLSLNQIISGQQKLLSDISHELRSPLTRLRMANALATRKQGSSNELSRIDTEAERLEKMISELLNLSRMQTNSHLDRSVISLTDLYGELLENAKFEAEQSGKTFTSSRLPARKISGNSDLLMSAVENVIRNAIHYSKSTVHASFGAIQDQLVISVEDDGKGVHESELDEIFRPFYRVDEARDRDSGGAGLGLAITSSAIAQHSGNISASRSTKGGLRVEITLPLST
jgi:two-component system sensor histidine kinase CpxA